MNNPTKLVLVTLSAAAAAWQLSCSTIECGEGTVEKDGVCTAAGELPQDSCGRGAVYDQSSGQCVADVCDGGLCGQCGPGTELQYSDAGAPVCVGVGGVVDCNSPIACPQGSLNKMNICGRLYDLETSAEIRDPDFLDGLEVTFYIALDFANDPNDPAAKYFSVDVDSCGRFAASSGGEKGTPVPGSQFIAVGVNDVAGSGADKVANSGVVIVGSLNGKNDDVKAFVLKSTTDAAWSTQAFGAGQQKFSERGVYVPIFYNTKLPAVGPFDGTPTAGVVITEDGSPNAANDFYFSDATALGRTTVATAQNATGMNGTGLYVNGDLVEYSGEGAEPVPGTCIWPSTLADAIPGVVFIQERGAATAAGGACP